MSMSVIFNTYNDEEEQKHITDCLFILICLNIFIRSNKLYHDQHVV